MTIIMPGQDAQPTTDLVDNIIDVLSHATAPILTLTANQGGIEIIVSEVLPHALDDICAERGPVFSHTATVAWPFGDNTPPAVIAGELSLEKLRHVLRLAYPAREDVRLRLQFGPR